MKAKKKWHIILAVILFIGHIVYESVYIIDEDEQIIITRFGRIEKGPIKEPGFHFKLYRIDQVVRYPSKEIEVDLKFAGCPRIITAYNATMRIIIVDPIMFYKTLYEIEHLQERLSFLLNERYCDRNRGSTDDTNISSSVRRFFDPELRKYGVSIVDIFIIDQQYAGSDGKKSEGFS